MNRFVEFHSRPIVWAVSIIFVIVSLSYLTCALENDEETENSPPEILAIPNQKAYLDTPFYINLASYVTDQNQVSSSLTYLIVEGEGSMDGPVFSAVFTEEGNKDVHLLVTDDDAASTTGVFSISVSSLTPATPTFPTGSIFVKSSGQDVEDGGTLEKPYGSIGYALEQAKIEEKTSILLACGVYIENIEVPEGINLLGGYAPDFSQYDIESLKAIVKSDNSEYYTLLAQNVNSTTRIEGIIFEGPQLSGGGAASSAIHLINCGSSLQIHDCIIFAGRSGYGSKGLDGTDGNDGTNGQIGADSYQTNTRNNTTCGGLASTPVAGSNGGIAIYGALSFGGGDGADSYCPELNSRQLSGSPGQGNNPGNGGSGGYNRYNTSGTCTVFNTGGFSSTGLSGSDGGDGTNGAGGAGGLCGEWSIVGNRIVTASGVDGSDGTPGSGGGGGGAGGGLDIDPGCAAYYDTLGPSGGGGGSGGMPGGGGLKGTGGGTTTGIFIHFDSIPVSYPIIKRCTIYNGIAGNGGDGGNGGTGGIGGIGAQGGLPLGPLLAFMGSAGSGGSGGSGGHGGGGGGGVGGDSFGIFISLTGEAKPDYASTNTFIISTGSAGIGGSGGRSLGNPGNKGQDGSITEFQTD